MKAFRLFALLMILVAVVANGSAGRINTIDVLCGGSNDPTLCDQTTGEDLFCTDYCGNACTGFTNVTATCVHIANHYNCKCFGDPVP